MDTKVQNASLQGTKQSRALDCFECSQRHTRTRRLAVSLINFYQKYLSLDTGIFSIKKGTTCVFYPTCSEYTKEAILKYGVFKGIFLGGRRILRCHPWQKEHLDQLE